MRKHDFIRDGDGWQTLDEEIHFQSPHVSLATHTLLTPTRRNPAHPAKWVVAHRKAAVVVAPLTANGDFVLVRQERIPIRASLWEFPAGQIDEESVGIGNEAAIEETARRELREETGYELPGNGQLIALGMFFTSQGFTDEHNYLYLARGVVVSSRGSEHGEHEAITDCRTLSPAELRDMIADGEIRDGNTLSLYARLCARDLI